MTGKSNVIPFRRRPASGIELEVYERMTRSWSPELRRLMFPEHYERERQGRAR